MPKALFQKVSFSFCYLLFQLRHGHLSDTFSKSLNPLVWSPRHTYNAFDVLFRSSIQLPREMFPQISVECHHHFRLNECCHEVFSLVLPSKAAFELSCRNEVLFSLLALALDILAMCTFVSLNVLETTLAIPYGIELRSRYTAVRCTTYFFCHVLSPFYLFVEGLTLFSGYQPLI
jgi:hypothetical protein